MECNFLGPTAALSLTILAASLLDFSTFGQLENLGNANIILWEVAACSELLGDFALSGKHILQLLDHRVTQCHKSHHAYCKHSVDPR